MSSLVDAYNFHLHMCISKTQKICANNFHFSHKCTSSNFNVWLNNQLQKANKLSLTSILDQMSNHFHLAIMFRPSKPYNPKIFVNPIHLPLKLLPFILLWFIKCDFYRISKSDFRCNFKRHYVFFLSKIHKSQMQ